MFAISYIILFYIILVWGISQGFVSYDQIPKLYYIFLLTFLTTLQNCSKFHGEKDNVNLFLKNGMNLLIFNIYESLAITFEYNA